MSKKFEKTILISAALLLLVACASAPPVQEQRESYIVQAKDLMTATNVTPTVGQRPAAAARPAKNLRTLNGVQRVVCTEILRNSHLSSRFETNLASSMGAQPGTQLALTLRHGYEDANPHAVARRHPLRAETKEKKQ